MPPAFPTLALNANTHCVAENQFSVLRNKKKICVVCNCIRDPTTPPIPPTSNVICLSSMTVVKQSSLLGLRLTQVLNCWSSHVVKYMSREMVTNHSYLHNQTTSRKKKKMKKCTRAMQNTSAVSAQGMGNRLAHQTTLQIHHTNHPPSPPP